MCSCFPNGSTPSTTWHPAAATVPRFVKVEANLLRLPLFALHTKGLRSLDAIECRGQLTRKEVTHEFTFRAFRSTATSYRAPGPFGASGVSELVDGARVAPGKPDHLELARSLPTDEDHLLRASTVERLKGAIHSTAGLYILSTHALFSKPDNKRISTREEGLRLYERVCFLGSELPDGRTADTNHLWLSDWYLANLNALFTAPLDYDLWLRLEDRSPIASRLYEFLLINFYSGVPVLRINYETLVQFLPIKPEQHPSQARQQLGPALKHLVAMEVIDDVAWASSRDGLAQLHFHRGKHLNAPPDRSSGLPQLEEFVGSVAVEEVRTLKPPEWTVVVDFHRLWTGQEPRRPTKGELELAELLSVHGPVKLKAMIQVAVKRMKVKWPDAKTFGGVRRYLDEAAALYDQDQKRLDAEKKEQTRRQKEREEAERQRARQDRFEATWRPVWDNLPEPERDAIRRSVVGQNPFLERMPSIAESFCLEELARRRGAAVS